MKIDAQFKTKARLFEQLGDQLIRNNSIALLELVKNSYDADASVCTIVINQPEDIENGSIIIEDDGEGMDENTLKTGWLEIGTDYKSELKKNEATKLTPKFKRYRLGEKGIGRFGVHKLGKCIKIITRKEDDNEYELTIDWNNISYSEYIETFPVSLIKKPPEHFKDKHGTRIEITKLRNKWEKSSARECARVITSLNSPFEDAGKFRADFIIKGEKWLEGLPSFKQILDLKLFSFDVTMKDDFITDFNYEFTPWITLDKVTSRKVDIEDET